MTEKIGKLVLGFVLAVLIMIPLAIWKGYVFSILWSWFVVSTFNLLPLTITQAIGIMIIHGFF